MPYWAAMIVMTLATVVGMLVAEDAVLRRVNNEGCELSCARHEAGKNHRADDTWCMCSNGLALKRDRSRTYVKVEGQR